MLCPVCDSKLVEDHRGYCVDCGLDFGAVEPVFEVPTPAKRSVPKLAYVVTEEAPSPIWGSEVHI